MTGAPDDDEPPAGDRPAADDDDRRETPGRADADDPGDLAPGDPLAFAPDERDLREAAPGDEPEDVGAGETEAGGPGSVASQDVRVREVARAVGRRWLASAIVLVLIVVGVSLLTFHNGRRGAHSVGAGDRLPPFAAPLATEPKLAHDAVNFAARAGDGDAGNVPACTIENPSVVTSCAELRRGPLVLAMFANGVQQCVTTIDDLDRLRTRYPRVQTLAVAIGGDHAKTATAVRNRRWRLPVAYDRDGGLASRLGSPACPFVLFVRPDGVVVERLFGTATASDLARGMARLAAAADSARPAATTTAAPGR